MFPFSQSNRSSHQAPAPLIKNTSPQSLDYELVRSARRRSISIEIADAKVVVRAPYFVAKIEIEKFVQEKARWIHAKLRQQQTQIENIPELRFETGQRIKYLGDDLELVVHKLNDADVVRYADKLLVVLSSRSRQSDEIQTRKLVTEWYQDQALALLTQKTHVAAAAIGSRCTQVTIKATRSKWGHCTTQGAIQYNWQILLAPEAIVDYLVAHEVSHLRHLNHSAEFWALVGRLCPDYKKRRAWLKTNAAKLRWA